MNRAVRALTVLLAGLALLVGAVPASAKALEPTQSEAYSSTLSAVDVVTPNIVPRIGGSTCDRLHRGETIAGSDTNGLLLISWNYVPTKDSSNITWKWKLAANGRAVVNAHTCFALRSG